MQGHTDIALNEAGREQAAKLRSVVEDFRPGAILTSDLRRAWETAEICNLELKLPLIVSPRLRECGLGDIEGRTRDEVLAWQGGVAWQRWASQQPADLDFAFPNGETKADFRRRLVNYLEEFCSGQPGYERIAVSTHGGSVRSVVHYCEGAPPEPVPVANCAAYLLELVPNVRQWRFVGPAN